MLYYIAIALYAGLIMYNGKMAINNYGLWRATRYKPAQWLAIANVMAVLLHVFFAISVAEGLRNA